MTLTWEEPGPSKPGGRTRRRPQIDWDALVSRLNSRPGEWALMVDDIHLGAASYLNRRYSDCEFVLRDVNGATHRAKLYGRLTHKPTEQES